LSERETRVDGAMVTVVPDLVFGSTRAPRPARRIAA